MIKFCFLLHDVENDAGELTIYVSFDGFSGKMSRFAGRAELLRFASNIKDAVNLENGASIVYTTVFSDVGIDEQPQAQCTVALSKFGQMDGVLIDVTIQDEVILGVASRKTASTRVAFVSTLAQIDKFATDIVDCKFSDEFNVSIHPFCDV